MDFREIVGCPPPMVCDSPSLESCKPTTCASKFNARRWTRWLINCPHRDPKRVGNPKFNFSDLTYLHRRYGNAFAALVNPAFTAFSENYDGRIRVWVYKGAKTDNLGTDNLQNVWGVLDRVVYANKLPASVDGSGPLLLPEVDGAVRIQPRVEDQPFLLPQAQNPITLLINQHSPVEVDAAIIVNNAFIRMHGRLNGLASEREFMDYMTASKMIADEPRLINEKDR